MSAPTITAVQKPPVDPAIGAAIEVYGRLNAIRNVLAPDLNDQELQLFAMVAERSRLDPFAKQIYAIKRKGRVTFQTGIDGFRSSAEDTGDYRGSDEPEFGEWIEKPFPHPEWARVVVHRQFPNGEWLHQPAKVFWDEFYPGEGEASFNWKKMPRNQLAKCAEAAGFRKAFPKRFADVYAPEEMNVVDAAEAARPVAPTAAERIAARRAEHEAQQVPAGAVPVATTLAEVAPCAVASPKGEPCLVKGPHTDHANGNKRWPTPKQGAAASTTTEPVSTAEATPPASAVDEAQRVFEGEVKTVGPDLSPRADADVQAGLELLDQPRGGKPR